MATDRLAKAAAVADRVAAAIEFEIGRLRLLGEDLGDLPAIASDLGALHGELDEIGHWLKVAR